MDNLEHLRGYMEEYLLSRGTSLRKAFRCVNPDHEDKHPSMRYNPRARNVHCFACGVTYDLFDLVGIDYRLEGFPDKVRKVCELFGEEAPAMPVARGERKARPKPVEAAKAADKLAAVPDRSRELAGLREKAEGGGDYLKGRGISRETCEAYGLFEAEGRAYFPVWEGGVCTGWCARAVEEGIEPRYKNSPGPLGVWNGDLLATPGGGKEVFVTEGILDALCLVQMGLQAVALCGSQNTGKLLSRCRRNPQTANSWRFVLCGDGDDAGAKMNEALGRELREMGISCRALGLEAADGDVAGLCRRDKARLEALVRGPGGDTEPCAAAEYAATSVAAALDGFFEASRRRGELGAVPTGFSKLDKLLDGGLYPGLYVMGAISSLGKTSFALQMADFIAENAADVLFFSLEQSAHELMAKSLSRTTAALDRGEGEAFTARQLLCGHAPETLSRRQLLLDAREAYGRAAAGLFIREGVADIGAGHIREAVREHLSRRGRAPVVVVDYLQILQPADPRATDKQNTDRSVVELKRISRDFDIPVLAISSFNRENYRAAVSMEAFKESGAVEYSSDVLLGLQLKGAGEKDFDQNAAKLKQPRQLELVLLKNRSGLPYAKLPISYDPRFSLFEEGGKVARLGVRSG